MAGRHNDQLIIVFVQEEKETILLQRVPLLLDYCAFYICAMMDRLHLLEKYLGVKTGMLNYVKNLL